METMEMETRHVALTRLFLKNLQGLRHGAVSVIVRNGLVERIDRTESDLVKCALRPVRQ